MSIGCSAVGAGNAEDAAAFPSNFYWWWRQNWLDLGEIWTKVMRFRQILLDLGKIQEKVIRFGLN